MAIEVSTPPPDDDGAIDVEVVEPGRLSRLKGRAAPHTVRASAVLAVQRANVTRRLAEWFTGTDVTDEQLAREIEAKRARAARQGELELRKRATVLRAQLNAASPERAAGLASQLADIESQMEIRRNAEALVKVDLVRARWGKKAGRMGAVALGGIAYVNGVAAEPLLALASLGAGPVAWWWLARPHADDHRAPATAAAPVEVDLSKAPAEPAAAPYGGATVAEPVFDAPLPPALDERVLTDALRTTGVIKPDAVITMLSAPAWDADGTATTVFDLPGATVAMLQKKADRLAGALGRDVSMIDISKAGTASRVSLWMSDSDPFEEVRPSPLMSHTGGIDVWRDGSPVGWSKRGQVIALPIKNAHFLIGGMTRSGKGVGMANLVAGATLDARVNIRVVAGKDNGEFDAYARAGVASTYFKQRPVRLLALTRALLADMDRRNRILGELGKSKMTPETIERLGGIELVVIDELATFTAKGSHEDRDELVENLMQLAAVATGAGIILVLTTQLPQVDVVPGRLAINCGTKWAMRVDTADQSNTILGGGASGAGRDASKFDPPRPGLGWLVNPFLGITDLARSFDLDEDERGEVTELMARAADLRNAAGRLAGQWDDPIETYLINEMGLSSAAGGPAHNGEPGRAPRTLTPEQQQARDALAAALTAMDGLGRDAAQLQEMAERIGDGMTGDRLGELLRAAGAGATEKVTIDGRGRVNGYHRATLAEALDLLGG